MDSRVPISESLPAQPGQAGPPPTRLDLDGQVKTGPYESTPPEGFSNNRETPRDEILPACTQEVSGRVGDYDLLEKVAQGGMGVIYKARHRTLGRLVALKTMRGDAALGPNEVQRFQREVRAAAALRHAHIVPIYEVGEQQGQPYYTMAFIRHTLASRRSAFAGEPRTAAALVEKIARAVQHAHEHGILHRDLKPSNILVDDQGEPLVADFGLAKLLDGDVELTRSGAVVGTPAYMAPEQAAGNPKAVGPATDVWSLGVILYELLAGRRPFPGENTEVVRQKILSADPAPLRSFDRKVDGRLATIALKCLRKDAGQRYGSPGALADDLDRWLRGDPILARPESLFRRVVRRNRKSVSTAIIVALTAGTVWAFSHHRAPDQVDTTSPSDPNRPVAELHRKISNGETVTLVGAAGKPDFHRWVTADEGLIESQDDQAFSISGTGERFLELLPNPPATSYRLRAQVQHHLPLGRNSSYAGLYFGHSRHSSERGVRHTMAAVTFDDWFDAFPVPGAPNGRQSAVNFVLFDLPESDPSNRSATKLKLFAAAGPAGTPLPFHEIRVDVSPKMVRVFWEGKQVGQYLRVQLTNDLAALGTQITRVTGFSDPTFRPEISPSHSIGLYVNQAKAIFRNVVFEPLPMSD